MTPTNDPYAVAVTQEVFDEFTKYMKGEKMPPTRSEFLHDVKFAHNYPHLQAWVEKCSILDYGNLYFHGMTVKA